MSRRLTSEQVSKFQQRLIRLANETRLKLRSALIEHPRICLPKIASTPAQNTEAWLELARQYPSDKTAKCSERLQQIDAALNEIELGLYGYCADCDGAIELERLLHDPACQRCGACGLEHEQKQSHSKRVWL